MNHIHCINKETGDFTAHFDDFATTVGVVVREGLMEETVRIHRIGVFVGDSFSALVIHTDLESNALLSYKLTPLVVMRQEDTETADRCARKFIHQHYLH